MSIVYPTHPPMWGIGSGVLLTEQSVRQFENLLEISWANIQGRETGTAEFFVGDYDTLELANAAASAVGGTLVFTPGDWAVSASITFPANVELRFLPGATLVVASGKTVTINGPFTARLHQIFDVTAGGTVAFGEASVDTLYPQWWGAVGYGVTDDTAAFDACYEAGNLAGIRVQITRGTYLVDGISIPSVRTLVINGAGQNATVLKRPGDPSVNITKRMMWFRTPNAGGSSLILTDMTINGNRSGYAGHTSNAHSVDLNPNSVTDETSPHNDGFDFLGVHNIHLVDSAENGLAFQGGGGKSTKTTFVTNITDDGTPNGDDAITVTMGFDVFILNNSRIKSFQMEVENVSGTCRFLSSFHNVTTTGRWKHNLGSHVWDGLASGGRCVAVNLDVGDMQNLCDNGYGEFYNLTARFLSERTPARGGFDVFGGRWIADAAGTGTSLMSFSASTFPEYARWHKVKFYDESDPLRITSFLNAVANNTSRRSFGFYECFFLSVKARAIIHRQQDIEVIGCYTIQDPSEGTDVFVVGSGQNNNASVAATITITGNRSKERDLVLFSTSTGQDYDAVYNIDAAGWHPDYIVSLGAANSLRAPWGSNATGHGVEFNQLEDCVLPRDVTLDASGFPTGGTHIRGQRFWYPASLTANGGFGFDGFRVTATGTPGSFSYIGEILLAGSATWDPGSVADGDAVSTTVTVTGAALGDFCDASFSLSVGGLGLTSYVSAANTVTVTLLNNTGSPVDLGSGTVRARVKRV